MYLFIIQNSSTSLFRWVLDILYLLGGLGIYVLTLYTFYLKFISKKIKCLGFSSTNHKYFGSNISTTIENLSLSNISIHKAKIVYNNKYIITIAIFDEPLILEPFKACNLKGKSFSYTSPELQDINKRDVYLILKTSKGEIFAKFRGKINKKEELIVISSHTDKYNNQIMSKNVKYILCYKGNDNELKTVFIDSVGLMSDEVMNFNAIPEKIILNRNAVKDLFKNIFEPLKIPFSLDERKTP